MNRVQIGDCRDILPTLPEGTFRCCVTSPPYWGLRDYGVDGQIGLEPTPDKYVAQIVDVFRAVRRVLTDDGTLWLNLGDSYVANRGMGNTGRHDTADAWGGDGIDKRGCGLKPKDLVGIPWMVAFALRADGWFLRSDIIWAKPNPMPESVTDRPTKAHEYLFLLSKSARYYYDADAIREPHTMKPQRRPGGRPLDETPRPGQPRQSWPTAARDEVDVDGNPLGRNRRTVWTIPTEPYGGAHFATFPRSLVTPCILAGSALGDVVLDPFMGSGTVGQVAESLGRRWFGCELNPDYGDLARERTVQAGLRFGP